MGQVVSQRREQTFRAVRPRVLLADDHRMLREVFAQILETDCDVVGAVGDGRALLSAASELKPDVVVLDIGMPLLNGLDAARQLKRTMPEVKIVVLTINEDPDLAADAIRAGASCYLLKNSAASELLTAIDEAMRGRSYITPLVAKGLVDALARGPGESAEPALSSPRQREVLQLLAEGRTMKEIGRILKITPRTVAFHKYGMMKQLGVRSTAELVKTALKLGVVSA
jgi:DNA-binding NarL/FixJ family response regulator